MPRPRNPIWDELDLLFGPCRTSTEASFRGKVVKELNEAGASIEELQIAYEWCRKKFDIFGEGAILKNFGRAQHEHMSKPTNVVSLADVRKMANPDEKGT